MTDVNLINGIALAFEGDAIYSMYIRRHLIFQGLTKPNQLHREATKYIYKRGRNANSHTKAKNTDIVTYRMSTGFEAVMGYLHMTEDIERLEELIDWCIRKIEASF